MLQQALGTMVMENPRHPGRSIKESCLDPLDLSVTEGARKLGVACQTLSQVLNGDAAISPEMAVRLEKAKWRSAEHWLRLQTKYDLAKARRNEDQIISTMPAPIISTMPMLGQSQLFSGEGKDEAFLAVRDNRCNANIQVECECLWNSFKELAQPNFEKRFSQNFRACFWEMYLGLLLRAYYPELKVLKSGPDFCIPWKVSQTFVEAASASRGEGADRVPDISVRSDDDDSVPFNKCILRVTAALKEKKSQANNAECFAKKGPYVIAVNLPFPEAWLGGPTPLSARATLGVGEHFLPMGDNDGRDGGFTNLIESIQKTSEERVGTMAFYPDCDRSDCDHVSALLVASVNPWSTCYYNPLMELLHNPRATKTLPREWLPVGTEYWFEGNSLRNSDHGNPTEAIARKNLPHPGRSIKENCLDLLELSVSEGARKLGVSCQTLSQVLNGDAAISPEMAVRLERAEWGYAELWLHRQTTYNLAQARRNEDQIQG